MNHQVVNGPWSINPLPSAKKRRSFGALRDTRGSRRRPWAPRRRRCSRSAETCRSPKDRWSWNDVRKKMPSFMWDGIHNDVCVYIYICIYLIYIYIHIYIYIFIYIYIYIYVYIIPTDYWGGGRELIVTYIFGDMLPQKCNLHFLICLDKCNLLFWGTIQEILHLKPENCKLHFWGNIRNCNLHFWPPPPENHG